MHHLLDHVVQQRRRLRICSPVIDLFAFPAADDQPSGTQQLQMVGHGRTAHLHHRSDIEDTLFAMAQQPEDTAADGVAQQLIYTVHKERGHGNVAPGKE